MCVLLCGVWSLKKARLRCDRLCWWPLNFNTLHNYTCIKIDKFILPKSDEISQNCWSTQQAWTWAGLRPIRTIGFDKPPVGRGKLDCWKTTRQLQIALSAFDALWNISFELGLTLGAWLSWLSLLNISGAALVTLPRHRLSQPSIRRRRIEGTTSKYNELNAYGRKESFLWRHAAASTSHVFPPESTRRRTNHPRGFRGQRPEQRIWRKRNTFQPAYCQQASTSN